MLSYIARRIVIMIPTLFLISIVCFFVIELPPGDIVSNRVQELLLRGGGDSAAQLENLRERYGLNDPQIVRYFRWIGRFLIGNMGYSLHFNTQVADLILERFAMTTLVAGLSLVFTWVVAFPIAIYSATNQYSIGDFFWTTVGFIGLAIPNFMFEGLRDHCTSQGSSRGKAADKVPGAHRPQSLLLHRWVGVALTHLGGGHHSSGARAAHFRTGLPAGVASSGHAGSRRLRHADRYPHRDRHPALRHSVGDRRSENSIRMTAAWRFFVASEC